MEHINGNHYIGFRDLGFEGFRGLGLRLWSLGFRALDWESTVWHLELRFRV